MKLYYITWNNCISNQMYVIVNAESSKERDRKFSEWCKAHPEDAPVVYSTRSVKIKDCLFLNEQI